MVLCWRPARKRHFLLLAVLACRVLGAQSSSAGTDLQAVARKVALPPGWALAREAPAAAEFVHSPGISAGGQPTAEQRQAAAPRATARRSRRARPPPARRGVGELQELGRHGPSAR